ncbi:TIR domain-containing protein [bacterium]
MSSRDRGTVEHSNKSKKAFVIMPLRKEFNSVFRIISKILDNENMKIKCLCSNSNRESSSIIENVFNNIETSYMVIADITDCNPNVLYELGYAHAKKGYKKCIILTQSINKVPFDLRHVQIIIYENSFDGADKLFSSLKKAVEQILNN